MAKTKIKTATKAQFDACLETMGATLDQDMLKADVLQVDAPAGKKFKANGLHTTVEQYRNSSQSWKGEAYAEVIARLAYGLEDCTDSECDTCHPV